ncbi:uhrf1-binding protein 1-like protein [Dermatophagoides farinae]|uniref:Uhrf1-binding protein 1-like protein n=1 Tax=Dermatophagoides farinae TaxID=6954 RepID=A0A9D4P4D2_DERFA|nr:UHRF1-binding protein 1-like [Dermatophagoides farinae]KAH7642845.1 uhrf1-binding protein 1-like protein [Dermatophagoides farinae]
MASLIKNQILKHLSKFTKNLSPDKLQLSAIKGSCEVTNIELDENVLMQLLELPVWMSLTRAYCNYASIKIQWMKLKTIPIFILLDEVIIEVCTCDDYRTAADGSTKFPTANQFNQDMGSYGFTQKVIDGITLSINSVMIQLTSKIFSASFELTRINIESRNCLWKKVDDLSKTRIRDPNRGQVLIFKHIEWQTLRFVAKSESKTAIGQAPLRLIANQASCRITLKKRLADCSVVSARIMLIFDDLLWVLTDSQLLSALHFADYLGELIKQAPRTKKFDNSSTNLMENQNGTITQSKMMNLMTNGSKMTTTTTSTNLSNSISLLFSQYDIHETSHHIIIRRIEVHLMDDLGPHSERSQCPELKDGGALQMSFHRLFIDLYPYHRCSVRQQTSSTASSLLLDDRSHWFRYSDPSPQRVAFITHKLNAFFRRQQVSLQREGSRFDIESLKSHLISQVLIVRLHDYSIGHVSTNTSSRNNQNNTVDASKLLYFDNSSPLPGNVPAIYLELNNYFFCEPFDRLNLPMPETNIFAMIAPVKLCFDPLTILWINSFFANLHNALIKLQEAFPVADNRNSDRPNIRLECLMPTIIIRLPMNNDDDQSNVGGSGYDCMEVKISKIILYNCDSFINREYFRNLDDLMKQFSGNIDFYYEHCRYPWLGCDLRPISAEFRQKIDRLFLTTSDRALNLDVDFFVINIEPIWIEIKSTKSMGECETLLEPVNVSLWLNLATENENNDDNRTTMNNKVDVNILARIADPIRLQLTHDQFMFLIRLIEMIGDFTSTLNYDTYMIQRSQQQKTLIMNNDDEKTNQKQQKYSKFDLEEKIIRTIFKNTSIVTHLPEVNIFLRLKQTDEEEETTMINSDDDDGDGDGDDNDREKHPSSRPMNAEIVSNVELLSSVSDDDGHEDRRTLIDCQQHLNDVDNKPNTVATNPSIEQPFVMMTIPKSHSSDLNGTIIKSAIDSKISNLMPPKKNSFPSFDGASIRIHYTAADNEDALSTISDFSADDSDQQSMIAMINGECDLLDDILDSAPVEEAVDILENLNDLSIESSNDLDDSQSNHRMKKNNPEKLIKHRTIIDALHIQVANVNLIQQSSKGFLSQVFINCHLKHLEELRAMPKDAFIDRFKNITKPSVTINNNDNDDDDEQQKSNNQITLRIDSYSKGTIKDELISVYVNNLCESLNKETIDMIVDFFNDKITEHVAPLAILVANVKFRIIDHSVRVPPILFTIPQLAINRNRDNKWIIETLNDHLSKGIPITNQLLIQHRKIFERNLIVDIVELVREQDRLLPSSLTLSNDNDDTQEILKQILNQKELLMTEIDLLRKENEQLRKIVANHHHHHQK